MTVTNSVSVIITGWDQVRQHQKDLLESSWSDLQAKEFRKENITVKVTGCSAWAINDNIWQWTENEQQIKFQNIQITFFEKINDEWKISFQAFIRDPEYPEKVILK